MIAIESRRSALLVMDFQNDIIARLGERAAPAIERCVLLGIATSGVVLSTLRHAADADYRLVVVADCCVDADEEVHRVLTEKVFTRQASVVSAAELTGALAQP